ncbi:MAG: MBL fold metallo-hydrolase [Nitrospirae bacterium]|nr:MBL fold metallo-hydrolase [Nitrospirota bacterium]
MIALSLQSGSSGNCIYVETGPVRLLFDAGICGIQAETRLAALGRDIRDVNAVIISHDHSDHVRYAGVYQRKYGLPVYATSKTMECAVRRYPMGRMNDVRIFRAEEALCFEGVSVETIPTPHDGVDGVAFVVDSKGKRLGIMTDLGHVFDGLNEAIPSLDGVFIESNYDPDMLLRGPYPSFLKKRIQGPGGHISNLEAAELLTSGKRLRWACLSHLSGENNTPALAVETHRKVLGRDFVLHTASRSSGSAILTL